MGRSKDPKGRGFGIGMKMITLFLPRRVIEEYDDLAGRGLIPNRSESMRNAVLIHLLKIKRLDVVTSKDIEKARDEYMKPDEVPEG